VVDENTSSHTEESSGDSGAHTAVEQGSGRTLKTIIIIAIAALVIIIAAAAGAFFFLHKGHHEEEEPESKPVIEAVANPGYYPMDEMIVNLSGDSKRPSYLKIKIVIELADEKDKASIDSIKPKIIDVFQTYLSELRPEDLKGSAGMFRLREELLIRISEISKPVRIRNILFQERLVQ
jgi:flagellar FliL protein